jgi:flagellin
MFNSACIAFGVAFVSVYLSRAANVALEVLRRTQNNLTTTQNHVSSGLRVQTAADNATYWEIATNTRTDIGALSAVQDALGLAHATVDVASTSVDSAADIVSQIKSKLVSAMESSVDKTKVDAEIGQLKDQLRSVGTSASFNGVNWVQLSGNDDPANPREVPASFIRSSNGTVSIGSLTYAGDKDDTTITPDAARYLIDNLDNGTGGHGVLTSAAFASAVGAAQSYVMITSEGGDTSGQVEIGLNSATTNGAISDMINVTEAMLTQLTTIGSAFGSMESRVDQQSAFAQSLSDSLTSGVGKLVDADMEVESTKLLALQTQAQIGRQSLSIANASYSMVNQLFQNIQ